MEFTKLTENEFAEFSEKQDNMNFWQSTGMAHLRKWNGWEYDYVGIKQEQEIIAAALISYRKIFMGQTFVQAPRGFYIDYENKSLMTFFHKELCKYLDSIHCMYFKIDPYIIHIERDINGEIVEGGLDHTQVVDTLKDLGYKHTGYLRGMTTEREPNWMFVKNIKDKTESELLKEFDSRARRMINKTINLGIQVKEITKDELSIYKAIMDHTSMRRGFQDHSLNYYEGLFETFGKEGKLKILVAQLDLTEYKSKLTAEKLDLTMKLEKITGQLQEQAANEKLHKKQVKLEEDIAVVEGKLHECEQMIADNKEDKVILGGATFILAGKEILYLYGGAYEKYMKFNAQYALQWYMFCYGVQHGYERHNFYGISGIFDKQDEGYGVYEFKRGFQGTVEELIGDFYLYRRPLSYKVYEGLRKVKHLVKRH